jgi:hypothetical protein
MRRIGSGGYRAGMGKVKEPDNAIDQSEPQCDQQDAASRVQNVRDDLHRINRLQGELPLLRPESSHLRATVRGR